MPRQLTQIIGRNTRRAATGAIIRPDRSRCKCCQDNELREAMLPLRQRTEAAASAKKLVAGPAGGSRRG